MRTKTKTAILHSSIFLCGMVSFILINLLINKVNNLQAIETCQELLSISKTEQDSLIVMVSKQNTNPIPYISSEYSCYYLLKNK